MESLSFGPLNSLCVDDPNMSESGVFRYSRRAKYGSRLSRRTFLFRFLAVSIVFSSTADSVDLLFSA